MEGKMAFNTSVNPGHEQDRPQLEKVDHRVIIILSLMLMLAINFTLTYLVHAYYSANFHDMMLPGFWLIVGNSIILWILFLLCKNGVGWKWKHIGLASPLNWWRPLVTTIFLVTGVLFIVQYVQPLVYSFTSAPNLENFRIFEGNLPLVLVTLIYVWLHGAFLQELIFRAFFINSVDILLGRNKLSPILAVISSSLAFGLIHSWQGWGGILLTTLMGLIFGFAYLFNGRRIWPLILVHGLLDTITLFLFYQGVQ